MAAHLGGVVLGWLLFAIFLTGTLVVFQKRAEPVDAPELHGLPTTAAGTEKNTAEKALAALHRKVPDVTQWIIHLPDERDPAVNVLWRGSGNGRFETLRMNPQTGEPVDIRQSMGGDFFYRFRFELRTAQKGRWTLEGRWVVGVATLLMFMALLTGVVTHRRIFKDFFTFRPGKGGQRAWLDAHNVRAYWCCRFNLMITFSGLMIFHSMYLPSGIATAYAGADGKVDSNTYFADLQGDQPERRARREAWRQGRAPAADPCGHHPDCRTKALGRRPHRLHPGAARCPRQTGGGSHPPRGRPPAIPPAPPAVSMPPPHNPWASSTPPAPPSPPTACCTGCTWHGFASPGLRWALFGFGLLGCLMIATGMVLWSVKRSAQAQRKVATQATPAPQRLPLDERLVAGLNIGTLAGLPLACAVFLAANRLLPLELPQRADTELACFFATWGLALVWGLLCPRRLGWTAVLALAAAAWALLPVLNALTTSAHLGATLRAGDWTWAALNLAFLAAGAVTGCRSVAPASPQPCPCNPCQARGPHPHSGAPSPHTGSARRAQRGLGNHCRNLKPCLPFCFASQPGWPWPWAWTNTTKTPWATRLPPRACAICAARAG